MRRGEKGEEKEPRRSTLVLSLLFFSLLAEGGGSKLWGLETNAIRSVVICYEWYSSLCFCFFCVCVEVVWS